MTAKYILTIFIVMCLFSMGNSQTNDLKLTLDDAIELASKQSIDAFRNKNMFRASYWEFRYYKADKLPGLNLDATPLDFSKYRTREYNFQTNEEEYVLREYLNSDFGLSLNQNVALTGGTLFLRSELGMTKNLGGDVNTAYRTTPISIGYRQELNGYNELKWESKIEPLKYEKAKKVLIQSNEELALETTEKFFDLVSAQIQLSIAENNVANNDTLYKIGKGRFQVGTVTQDQLLNLELNLLNSKQALNSANLELIRAQSDLNSFLGLDKNSKITCDVVDEIPELEIKANDAISKALENNPEILDQKQQLLAQDQMVAQAKAETGLNTSILAWYGLDQAAPEFKDAYSNPDQSQRFRLTVNIPIVDWGKRKGRYQMAESNREVARASIRQARIDFEQNVFQTVMEFNLQAEQVRNAILADKVAKQAYEVAFQRFMIGKVDVIVLNEARTNQENARKAYVTALNTYWNYYYAIRQLTLFDFANNETLSEEYEKILQN